MRLLVTGGAGFIGSNFIHYWLEQHPNDQIVNLDKLTYAGNLENLKDVETNPNYSFVQGDIVDAHVVEQAIDGADVVVHFAAETHVDRSIDGAAAFIKTNVEGTYILLEAARKNNTRFHHISTDEVFGSLELNSNKKFTHESQYRPNNPYSASKAASDHLVHAYHRTYGLPVTISNTSNNFGPYHFPEKFIPLAITNILEGKKIPIYGNGQQVRDWLYVADHCRGVDLILHKGKIGETYLIGGMTDDIPNYNVAKMILEIMGKDESSLEYIQDRPGHDVRYAVDWSKTKDELGYEPLHSFKTYLEKTVQWFVDNKDWWQRVKSGAYQAYYQKQYGNR